MAGKKNAERIAAPKAAARTTAIRKVAERVDHPTAAIVYAKRIDA